MEVDMGSIDMTNRLNEFQIAVVQACTDGSLCEAMSQDAKRFLTKLKKDPNAGFLAALVEDLGGAKSVGEAATRLVNAEIDLKRAFSAIGSISMRQASHQNNEIEITRISDDIPLQPELV
jgi:hypothetical protein